MDPETKHPRLTFGIQTQVPTFSPHAYPHTQKNRTIKKHGVICHPKTLNENTTHTNQLNVLTM